MPHRIEVAFKDDQTDALSAGTMKRIADDLDIRVRSVRTVEVYTIDKELTSEQLDFLARELFADPITQHFSCDRPLITDFDWLVEVGYKPGVTDNVGRTAATAIQEMIKSEFRTGEAVYTSRQYLINGSGLKKADLDNIARNVLGNDMVQRWNITSRADALVKDFRMPVPRVNIRHTPSVERIELGDSDDSLVEVSNLRKLALNLIEMQTLRAYFHKSDVAKARNTVGLGAIPTDAELEVIGQSWSEHCKHKIFNAVISYTDESGTCIIESLFDSYIKKSTRHLQEELDWVVSTLWDNSGVMRFNDDWLIALKCETHNSPSNEEPYGGALTGIVGVYRDPMGTGQGCKLVYGTYGFCTGNPHYQGPLKPKLHPRRLLEGVRKGVEHGGNKHGVPTPYGITFFDDGYMGKPAIFVLAAGLIPSRVHGKPGYEKNAVAGDLIVMCGGRVGIDGIHGATESSMEAGEWITAGHVQIGDPFTQKKMHDFLNEARDRGLYRCITDNGAGGLSSSVGEMAQYSNGFEMHLDRVPLKYSGLDPWQILVSESQERMTLAVPPDTLADLNELARKHDVEISVLGTFTSTGKFHTLFNGQTVTYLDMEFVHKGLPQMELQAKWASPQERGLVEPELEPVTDHDSLLREMLARENICSKEYITRQYDHEVQGTSAVKPLVGKNSDVNSDAAVVRPVLSAREGIAISVGMNPTYGLIDTYHMAACAIDEAIRRIIAVGGSLKQIALNDNFCWPSPLPTPGNVDAEYKLAQLVRANQALYDYTLAFKTPCISGKDSMSMDGTVPDSSGAWHRISALPTLQFSAAGKIDDVTRCVTMDVKRPGDLVYIIGTTRNELGGSEYYRMKGVTGLNVPCVNAETSIKLYNAISSATELGLLHSAHGCYRGGLGVALAQTAFAGGYGIRIDLRRVPANGPATDEELLYSESAGRLVVTVPPQNSKQFEDLMQENVFRHIGHVTDDGLLSITGLNGDTIVESEIESLKESWQQVFRGF